MQNKLFQIVRNDFAKKKNGVTEGDRQKDGRSWALQTELFVEGGQDCKKRPGSNYERKKPRIPSVEVKIRLGRFIKPKQ